MSISRASTVSNGTGSYAASAPTTALDGSPGATLITWAWAFTGGESTHRWGQVSFGNWEQGAIHHRTLSSTIFSDMWNGSTRAGANSASGVPVAGWSILATRFDGTQPVVFDRFQIYYGTAAGIANVTTSSSNAPEVVTSINDQQFGMNRAGSFYSTVNTRMAHAQAFNRALSVDEMMEAALRPGSIADGLVVHWPLTDDGGTHRDLSGNGFDGTEVNQSPNADGPPVRFGVDPLVAFFPAPSGPLPIELESSGIETVTMTADLAIAHALASAGTTATQFTADLQVQAGTQIASSGTEAADMTADLQVVASTEIGSSGIEPVAMTANLSVTGAVTLLSSGIEPADMTASLTLSHPLASSGVEPAEMTADLRLLGEDWEPQPPASGNWVEQPPSSGDWTRQ